MSLTALPSMMVWLLSLSKCCKTCFQKISNPYVGILSDAELTEQIAQQLKIEASDKITVQSVVPEPKLTPVITAAVSHIHCSLYCHCWF